LPKAGATAQRIRIATVERRCGVSRRTLPAEAASEEKEMEAELRHVLEAAFSGEEARYFLPMSIGSVPETADEGAVLILNGTKTLTSSPFWDYPDGKIPFVGALGVLLDGSRRPRGIVETTRVEIMPLGRSPKRWLAPMARGSGRPNGGVG
jgi:uncharacterized protein YhfF